MFRVRRRRTGGIPCAPVRRSVFRFFSWDGTALYTKEVIEPFVDAYRRGETPNPDVLCNTFLKFGAFADFLLRKGFPRFATGHYARTRVIDGETRLFRSVDEDKDQTYFIHAISSAALNRVSFPVGGLTKAQVRSHAARARLPAAEKKDSAGLCFLGEGSLRTFLSAYIAPVRGEVRLVSGECVGTHDGARFYTEGQRHGFTVSAGGPYVVVHRDTVRNIVFVAPRSAAEGMRAYGIRDAAFRRVPDTPLHARLRHRGGLLPAVFDSSGIVRFAEPQVIAAGQSVVFYTPDGECVGGGVCSGGILPDSGKADTEKKRGTRPV